MTDVKIPDADTPEFIVSLVGCARCQGEGHRDLVFKKLEHPHQPWDDHEAYTHWGWCPVNGEPILLAFADESLPDARPGVTPLPKESDMKVPPS